MGQSLLLGRDARLADIGVPDGQQLFPTYIPMARGFLYLVAIMDWCSRDPEAPGAAPAALAG